MSKLRRESVTAHMSMAQWIVIAGAVSTLVACSTRLDNAPVIDRSPSAGINSPTTLLPPGTVQTVPGSGEAAAPLGPPPPGYYRVKPGDTLYRIALINGRNYRDIATWNNIQNPNQIEVDQLLRVAPPGTTPSIANTPDVSAAPLNGSGVSAVPLGPANNGVTPPVQTTMNPPPGTATGMPAPTPPAVSSTPAAGGAISFAWPVRGPILHNFDSQADWTIVLVNIYRHLCYLYYFLNRPHGVNLGYPTFRGSKNNLIFRAIDLRFVGRFHSITNSALLHRFTP